MNKEVKATDDAVGSKHKPQIINNFTQKKLAPQTGETSDNRKKCISIIYKYSPLVKICSSNKNLPKWEADYLV